VYARVSYADCPEDEITASAVPSKEKRTGINIIIEAIFIS